MTTVYCACETSLLDPEHDAACRRCGMPVDFSTPIEPCPVCGNYGPVSGEVCTGCREPAVLGFCRSCSRVRYLAVTERLPGAGIEGVCTQCVAESAQTG